MRVRLVSQGTWPGTGVFTACGAETSCVAWAQTAALDPASTHSHHLVSVRENKRSLEIAIVLSGSKDSHISIRSLAETLETAGQTKCS